MKELSVLKQKLGIITDKRDDYLKSIISGIKSELTNIHGIDIEEKPGVETPDFLFMFIVDYAEFRYNSKGENHGMPEHLRFRLRNLYVKYGGKNEKKQ